MASIYKSGSVETYDDRAGYGYIVPDAPEESAPRLLVHRRSLRSPTLLLVPGECVLFRTAIIPRGLLASDVHLETPDEPSGIANKSSPAFGVITSVTADRYFGFIKGDDGARRVFHFSQITGLSSDPTPGLRVSFQPLTTERGLQARDIQDASRALDNTPATASAEELLALAILARDFEEAGRSCQAL